MTALDRPQEDLRAAIEGVYLVKLGAGEPVDALWTKALEGASADALGFLMRRLNRALEELRYGDSPRLALELGGNAPVIVLPDVVDLEAVARAGVTCTKMGGELPIWLSEVMSLSAWLKMISPATRNR